MGERTCEGCRWFQKFTSQTIGECRRHPPQHPQTQRGWLMVERGEFCGEWADKNITPEQAERRELIKQFAVALVASGSEDMVHKIWQMAAVLADYEGQV